MIVLPPDATTDATFRCAKWSCTLAVKHCLRRQAETREAGKNATDKAPVIVFPYCATECQDGRDLRARFGLPAARAPLTIAGKRRPEEPMPKGIRTKPKECCGSMGSRCLSTCTGKKPAPKLPEAPKGAAARVPRVVKRPAGGPEGMTVEDLLELRARVDEEIQARLADAEAQVEKLRAAVAHAAQQARAAAEDAA